MIDIYTDGACSGNPGVGGWAIVIKQTNTVISNYSQNTTNNQMELQAVLCALENSNNQEVNIYTDSAYIYNCFKEKWYEKWLSNGWLTTQKQPVKNKEIWNKILLLYTNKTHILKVKGHADDEYNNLADKYAVLARLGQCFNGEIK